MLRSLCLFTFALVATGAATADSVIPGPASDTIEGSSSNTVPFNADFNFGVSFQQVWDDAAFGATPKRITQIGWRLDEALDTADFDFDAFDYQMKLSTTSAEPGSLSTTYADNPGADETLVFSGNAVIDFDAGPGGPNPFAMLTLDTPFDYDPTAGNLLMEVRYFGSAVGIGSVDAYDDVEAAGVTSRVFTLFDGAAATGNASVGFSPVTKFEFTEVPEPATLALCLMGLGAIATRRRSA